MLDTNLLSNVSSDARKYLALTNQISTVAAWGAASKAGSIIQMEARRNIKSHRTNWALYRNKNGKVSITNKADKRVGDRQSHSTAKYVDPLNMSSMITSYQNYKSKIPFVVVGGRHRLFYPYKIDDGQIKGYMDKVNPVSEATHALLEKMETGNLGGFYSKHFGQKKKNVTAYHFMRDAVASKSGEVDRVMQKEWAAAVNRGLANATMAEVRNVNVV